MTTIGLVSAGLLSFSHGLGTLFQTPILEALVREPSRGYPIAQGINSLIVRRSVFVLVAYSQAN
jgi:hypothetical protein